MSTTNIDDVLTGNASSAPVVESAITEEKKPVDTLPEFKPDEPEPKPDEPSKDAYPDEPEPKPKPEQEPESETDDYGNHKENPTRTYSEDEVNERINKAVRDRLSRMKQDAAQQPQQAKKDFEYNEESNESWQEQLEQFVEQTVGKMTTRKEQTQQKERERTAQLEFEDKFHAGMGRFKDFIDVVQSQPISDAMTMATRGMTDPAAFLYAASKRAPDDLKRISNINDFYTQMVEMGKLEERMKRGKVGTTAPRPLKNTREDSSFAQKSDKAPSIEDLIAADSERRLKIQNDKRRR